MERKIIATAAATALAAALLAGGCSSGETTQVGADPARTQPAGSTASEVTLPLVEAEPVTAAVLAQVDADGLAFMREEEKLAGDVYRAMDAAWDLPIFANIAEAETVHTNAIVDLLDSYQLPDPAEDLAPGEFSNPDLQALYNELVETGSQSVDAALEVGALIEELDITDLHLRETGLPDIDFVYSNLERGSGNHLRAFNRQLERSDIAYTPIHLDQDTFDQIISTPTQRGGYGL